MPLLKQARRAAAVPVAHGDQHRYRNESLHTIIAARERQPRTDDDESPTHETAPLPCNARMRIRECGSQLFRRSSASITRMPLGPRR